MVSFFVSCIKFQSAVCFYFFLTWFRRDWMNVEAWRSFTWRLNFVDLIPAKYALDECSLDDFRSKAPDKKPPDKSPQAISPPSKSHLGQKPPGTKCLPIQKAPLTNFPPITIFTPNQFALPRSFSHWKAIKLRIY